MRVDPVIINLESKVREIIQAVNDTQDEDDVASEGFARRGEANTFMEPQTFVEEVTANNGVDITGGALKIDSVVVLGQDRVLKNHTLEQMADSSLPAAGASMDGKILFDVTNSRLIYYVGGLRYYVEGTAF